MGYYYVENLYSSKPSPGRVFVSMFVNRNGAPMLVDFSEKPYMKYVKHGFVKFWNEKYGEPARIVVLGTVYKTWGRKAVRVLNEMFIRGGLKIIAGGFSEQKWDEKTALYRVDAAKLHTMLNIWGKKLEVKKTQTVTVKPQPVEGVTKTVLKKHVETLKDSMAVEELNLLLRIVDTYDERTGFMDVVFMPTKPSQPHPRAVKTLLPKTRWCVVLKGDFKPHTVNRFMLNRGVKRKLGESFQFSQADVE